MFPVYFHDPSLSRASSSADFAPILLTLTNRLGLSLSCISLLLLFAPEAHGRRWISRGLTELKKDDRLQFTFWDVKSHSPFFSFFSFFCKTSNS